MAADTPVAALFGLLPPRRRLAPENGVQGAEKAA